MMKKILSLISILALSIGSFFAFFSPKKNDVAYAESVYDLPNVYVYTELFSNFSSTQNNTLVFFKPLFSSSVNFFSCYFCLDLEQSYPVYLAPVDTSYNEISFSLVRDSWQEIHFGHRVYDVSINAIYHCSSAFDFNNIQEIFFGSSRDNYSWINNLNYIDGNGNALRFEFRVFTVTADNSGMPYILWTPSTSYTSVVDSDSISYQSGYNNGSAVGYELGKNDGYSNGYNVGYSAGDVAGYQRGVNASNQYSFGNLLFAVVDTPVTIFRSLFDFEILGVNLSGFFFSLLTVAVVIAVVRFILAK